MPNNYLEVKVDDKGVLSLETGDLSKSLGSFRLEPAPRPIGSSDRGISVAYSLSFLTSGEKFALTRLKLRLMYLVRSFV